MGSTGESIPIPGRGLTLAGLLDAVSGQVERELTETFANDVRDAGEHLTLLLALRFEEADLTTDDDDHL